jgi:hypothetical protein
MLPTPDAAADAVLEMADEAPLVAFVSHDCCVEPIGMWGFCVVVDVGFLTAGRGFFCVVETGRGFFWVVDTGGRGFF